MSKTRSTTPLHRVLWGSWRQPTRTGDSALTVWGLCTHTNSRGHLFPSPWGHALPHHSQTALQYCESLFITLLLQLKLLLRHIPYFATSEESLLVFPVIQCCFNNSYPPFKAQIKCQVLPDHVLNSLNHNKCSTSPFYFVSLFFLN